MKSERLGSPVASHTSILGPAVFDGPDRAEELAVEGDGHQRLQRSILRERHTLLFPEFHQIMAPSLPHAWDKDVWPSQEQHARLQRLSAGEHREILNDDGVKQRGHQLPRRNALLLQSGNVGFGKDAALACNRMNLKSVILLLQQFFGGEIQLGGDLLNHGAGSAGTFVVHGGDLLTRLLASLLKDNDLRVLAAEFNHRLDIGEKALDRQTHRRDFLHKLCAQ